MTLSKQTLAIVVTGLVSLTWVGVSAAVEGDDPVLDDQIEIQDDACPVEGTGTEAPVVEGDAADETDPCAEEETDEGAVDDVTVDDTADDTADEAVEGEAVEGESVDDAAEEHPENHGRHVSEAARETCPAGPEHGQCVRAVAQSDVGKAGTDDDDAAVATDATEDDEPTEDDSTDDSTDDATDDSADDDEVDGSADDGDEDAPVEAATATSGNGNGNGNGRR